MTAASELLPLPAKGATVDIFGRKISWDALLVAGAGLAGVIFLYKFGQPTGTLTPSSTVDPAGGGADAGSISTVPAAPPGPTNYTPSGTWPVFGGYAPASTSTPQSTTVPQATPSGQVMVPVQNASYQVPVASSSYEPSGAGGLTAGTSYVPTSSAPAPSAPSAPSSGGLGSGLTQGSYTAPSPSSPPPPSTAPVPAPAGGGAGSFTP